MTSPEPYRLAIHHLFGDYSDSPSEVLEYVVRFVNGDCGDLRGEDEILGFLNRGLKGQTRHAVYETKRFGRIHIVGDADNIFVMPDLVYAQEVSEDTCTINTCTCSQKQCAQPTPTP